MGKRFPARLAAWIMALLLALPFAGGAEPAPAADAPYEIEVIPAEPPVPEAEGWELQDPALQIELTDVAPPEDETPAGEPAAPTENPEATDVPEATETPDPAETTEATETPEPTATPEPTETPEPTQTPEPTATPEPTSEPPRLTWTRLKMGVGETYRLTFSDGANARQIGAKFTSSDDGIVSVDRATGRLKALSEGQAKITVKLEGGVKRTCRVTVRKAPEKIKASPSKTTMGVGQTLQLKVSLNKGASSAIAYTSSDERVATVDENGVITATGKGEAKITAATYNKLKAVCRVTVKKAPRSVSLGVKKLNLWQDDTFKLQPELSRGSAGKYSIRSSDKAVVSVRGRTLTAVAPGTATVTVKTYNGCKAKVKVTVSRRPVYRALLIGESEFPLTGMSSLPGVKDADAMKKMLSTVQGPAKGDWKVTIRYNRMSSKIHTDIQTAFAGAQEGDISLFYISTHGDEMESFDGFNSEYVGCLYTYPNPNTNDWYERNVLTLSQLAAWLKEVPGQVVVFIDSCGSGAAIYAPKGVMAAPAVNDDPRAFNEAVVDAFAARDQAVMAPSVEKGAFVVRNKFYVMTSTAYRETGWSSSSNYSYFTRWLTDGIGTKGPMPADANGNAITTLSELYDYVSGRADEKVFEYYGQQYRQHVQVYPAGSGLELFYRK